MDIKIFRAYVKLCKEWDKEISWQGLNNFRLAFK